MARSDSGFVCHQHDDMVPAYRYHATRSVLADRERELLELKGPCRTDGCPLHYAHSGPCNLAPTGAPA